MFLLLLIITVSIFLSYYFLFIRLKLDCPHQKVILASLLSGGQIILTQLFLGIVGWLYLPALILLNIGGVLIVLLCARVLSKDVRVLLQQEYGRMLEGIGKVISPENILLFIILGIVFISLVITTCFFPIKNDDALTYHLPPIYEYVINHKIFLLPVEFNKRFAFPENAELLFMWPVIFLHGQQFVNSFQLIVVLWGIVVIFGLARMLGLPSKVSLFVSLLFPMTPVVLFQMGSCYIEIITFVFFLTVLYCAGMFYKTNRLLYFYYTALAAGLLCGMKYNEILLILMALPFLCMKRVPRPRQWFYFIVIFMIAGGFWYWRNFGMFKTPIYPAPFSQDSLGIYSHHPENVTFWKFLERIPSKLLLLWKDIGLGTEFGGYGLIFWGLALPAWFYVWGRAIILKNRLEFWVYSPLIIGVGQLLWVSQKDYYWISRYSLFMVGLGLLALGKVITVFDQFVSFRRTMKILCVLFAVLAAVHLSWSADLGPNYRIDRSIKDLAAGEYLSKESYCMEWPDCQAWAVMDYLTMNASKGLSCYVAPLANMSDVGYIYGTKLQNTIWNLQQDKTHPPDAVLYLNIYKDVQGKGLDEKFTFRKMMTNPEYFLIIKDHRFSLFMRKDFFKDPQKQQLLTKYYKIIGKAALVPK